MEMEMEQIKDYLQKGRLWDYIVCEELNKKHKGDIESKEILFLCCLGRKVKNKRTYSYNVITLVPSSSGKDHLSASVLKMFSREDYETYGRISAKSLNYLHSLDTEPTYTYDGKIIYLKEITEEILNNEVMKEFTSGEEEISQVAITKQKGLGVDVVRIRGHPIVITTTATTIPTDEIRNRFNIVKLDLSEEQTRRTFICEEEKYDENIRIFLSNLKDYEVEIPKELFKFIVDNFPKSKIRYRRDFQRLLDFIRAITLFNQEIRERNGNVLVAEPEDYERAKDVFVNAFSNCSDIPLKDIDSRIIKILEKDNTPIPAKKILNELGGIINLSNLYPHLRNLVAKEILNELTDRDTFNNIVTNYVLSVEFKDKKPFVLPNYYQDASIGSISNIGIIGSIGILDNDTTSRMGIQNNAIIPIKGIKGGEETTENTIKAIEGSVCHDCQKGSCDGCYYNIKEIEGEDYR
jgi:hypothetical protein